jgi:hypothetical protein
MIDILPVHLIMDVSNTDNLIYDDPCDVASQFFYIKNIKKS